jgi:hypothetical protein
MKRFWWNYLLCWIELFESIVSILTLGFIRPWWSFSLMYWDTKRQFNKVNKK